jgi:hypothetical protein
MSDKAAVVELPPEANVVLARRYARAAQALLDTADFKVLRLEGPTYMLIFHSIELALKGYLMAKGVSRKELKGEKVRHNLPALYAAAKKEGMRVEPKRVNDVDNVLNLLQAGSADKDFAYRYETPKSTTRPEIKWAAEIADFVVGLVENVVDTSSNPGPAVKMVMTVSKPRPQKR